MKFGFVLNADQLTSPISVKVGKSVKGLLLERCVQLDTQLQKMRLLCVLFCGCLDGLPLISIRCFAENFVTDIFVFMFI